MFGQTVTVAEAVLGVTLHRTRAGERWDDPDFHRKTVEAAEELQAIGRQWESMLAACKGMIHHDDGVKDAYKMSPSLRRQIEAAVRLAEGGAA